MKFQGMEDRLNPIAPPGVDDTTLGGYAAVHGRAPAFEGPDGAAYTAAIEAEETDDGGWVGYIVFVRWASEGSAIMGHVETDDLVSATSRDEAVGAIGALPLTRVKDALHQALARKAAWEREADPLSGSDRSNEPAPEDEA